MTARAELLYADFGTFHYTDSPAANGCVQCYSANVKRSQIAARFGITYKFMPR